MHAPCRHDLCDWAYTALCHMGIPDYVVTVDDIVPHEWDEVQIVVPYWFCVPVGSPPYLGYAMFGVADLLDQDELRPKSGSGPMSRRLRPVIERLERCFETMRCFVEGAQGFRVVS